MSDCKILVVGAGPVGLTTAIGFANRGYKDIVIIEKNTCKSLSNGGPRSYCYRIDARGRDGLRVAASNNTSNSQSKFSDLLYTLSHPSNSVSKIGMGAYIWGPGPSNSTIIINYNTMITEGEGWWTPREKLLQVLEEEIGGKYQNRIKIMRGAEVVGVEIVPVESLNETVIV